MAAELTKDTIDVDLDGEIYVFRIPTPREYAKVQARAHAMRRQDSPDTMGSEYGLDPGAADSYRGMALMEILLTKADTKDNWPYTKAPNGDPVVDSAKFPPRVILILPRVYQAFEVALVRFLGGGPGDGNPVGEAAVGGEPGTS